MTNYVWQLVSEWIFLNVVDVSLTVDIAEVAGRHLHPLLEDAGC